MLKTCSVDSVCKNFKFLSRIINLVSINAVLFKLKNVLIVLSTTDENYSLILLPVGFYPNPIAHSLNFTPLKNFLWAPMIKGAMVPRYASL